MGAREQIWANTVPTLQVTAVGFTVSLAHRLGDRGRRRLLAMAAPGADAAAGRPQTLPIIAIAPLLIIWFGFGLLPKVVVIALVTFFPIAIGLIEGFAATDRQATNLLRSMGASRLAPVPATCGCPAPCRRSSPRCGSASPTPSRVRSSPSTWAPPPGWGSTCSVQKNSFRTDLVLAAVVVTAAVSVALFALTYLVQRRRAPWSRR